jgi:transposase
VVEGIVHRLRTGAPWRDLPEEFGPWQTAWKRHRKWAEQGVWDQVHQALVVRADAAGRVDCEPLRVWWRAVHSVCRQLGSSFERSNANHSSGFSLMREPTIHRAELGAITHLAPMLRDELDGPPLRALRRVQVDSRGLWRAMSEQLLNSVDLNIGRRSCRREYKFLSIHSQLIRSLSV